MEVNLSAYMEENLSMYMAAKLSMYMAKTFSSNIGRESFHVYGNNRVYALKKPKLCSIKTKIMR